MFQGPKGYIAQICEVQLQYGNSTTKWLSTSAIQDVLSSILHNAQCVISKILNSADKI